MHEDEQARHDDLLAQLRVVSERVTSIAADQRTIVELMHDFRDLLRLMATHMRSIDGEIARLRAGLPPVAGHSQRIDRHLRN